MPSSPLPLESWNLRYAPVQQVQGLLYTRVTFWLAKFLIDNANILQCWTQRRTAMREQFIQTVPQRPLSRLNLLHNSDSLSTTVSKKCSNPNGKLRRFTTSTPWVINIQFHAFLADPKSVKNRSQFFAKTSVASSTAWGNGLDSRPSPSAFAYGSRHQLLTLI